MYMVFTCPNHALSLFVASDLERSSLNFAVILFSRPMFLSACIQLGIMSEITTMLATLLFQSEFRHQPATLLIQCN
jgi:hypothetical protein